MKRTIFIIAVLYMDMAAAIDHDNPPTMSLPDYPHGLYNTQPDNQPIYQRCRTQIVDYQPPSTKWPMGHRLVYEASVLRAQCFGFSSLPEDVNLAVPEHILERLVQHVRSTVQLRLRYNQEPTIVPPSSTILLVVCGSREYG